jgi:TM2 domain-containing membrane protein YozV
MTIRKNKTFAAWLAFIGGPLGLHRFYLHGIFDWVGWLLPIPTALGFYGIQRIAQFGQDDQLSWLLVPMLGFVIAGCALMAIIYALTPPEKWNAKFNPSLGAEAAAGQTNWLTVGAIVFSLMIGAAVLMASIAFSFQRYFEHQIEAARQISQ